MRTHTHSHTHQQKAQPQGTSEQQFNNNNEEKNFKELCKVLGMQHLVGSALLAALHLNSLIFVNLPLT